MTAGSGGFGLFRAHAASFVRYSIVGASGVLVNLGIYLLALRGLAPGYTGVLIASTVAFAGALLWNFAGNFLWTFRGEARGSVLYHLGLYAAIQLVSYALNESVLAGWLLVDPGAKIAAQLIGVLAGSVWGYAANRRWNFRSAAPGTGPDGAAVGWKAPKVG